MWSHSMTPCMFFELYINIHMKSVLKVSQSTTTYIFIMVTKVKTGSYTDTLFNCPSQCTLCQHWVCAWFTWRIRRWSRINRALSPPVHWRWCFGRPIFGTRESCVWQTDLLPCRRGCVRAWLRVFSTAADRVPRDIGASVMCDGGRLLSKRVFGELCGLCSVSH